MLDEPALRGSPFEPPLADARATAQIKAVFRNVRGQTQLVHSFCAAPLKIAKTFPLNPSQISVCMMDCSPGLLAGDCYEMDWQLEAGAQVFLTNQSFTRVHPSQDNPCSQNQRITLGEDALLEYLPEPVMLYRGAALHSTCDIQLAPGSTLLLSEILCAGRTLRDEIFQFHLYHSRLRVHYENQLIFCNQVRYSPHHHNPRTLAAWGQYTHTGNFYVFCDRLNSQEWNDLLQRLRNITEQYPMLCSGVSLTYRHGLAVSTLGQRAWDIQQMMQQLRQIARNFVSA